MKTACLSYEVSFMSALALFLQNLEIYLIPMYTTALYLYTYIHMASETPYKICLNISIFSFCFLLSTGSNHFWSDLVNYSWLDQYYILVFLGFTLTDNHSSIKYVYQNYHNQQWNRSFEYKCLFLWIVLWKTLQNTICAKGKRKL